MVIARKMGLVNVLFSGLIFLASTAAVEDDPNFICTDVYVSIYMLYYRIKWIININLYIGLLLKNNFPF